MVVQSQTDIQALEDLVLRLEKTQCLKEVEIFKKEQARSPNFSIHSREDIASIVARSKPRAPLARSGPFDTSIGNPNHDLGYHTRIVSLQFDDWFNWAHMPPPYSSKRILAITKRSKLFEMRQRFQLQLDKHLVSLNKPVIRHQPSGDDTLDFLQGRVPRLKVELTHIDDLLSEKPQCSFEFMCLDCGGYVMTVPDDWDACYEAPAICKSCEQVFGTFEDVEALALHIGNTEIARLKG